MDMTRLELLFHQCMEGSCSAEERAEMLDLLTRPEHEALARDLIREQHGRLEEYSVSPVARQEILQAIFQTDKDMVQPKKRGWYRYAAAAAVLLLAGYLWMQRPGKKDPGTIVQQAALVQPGSSKATLTLADGSVIALDSNGNRTIGAGIRQQGDQLQYAQAGGGQENAFNKLSIPRGGQFRLQLPDGTQVWLNAESSIRYPTAFTVKTREVEVTGEVYFEVAKQAGKPFFVRVSNDMKIEVLGTRFNINAYADEPSLRTTLLQGSVRIGNLTLQPGEQAVLKNGVLDLVKHADTDKVMAWKNGLFNFENAKLDEVMRQISRWYDIEVVYEKGIPDIYFAGEMSRKVTLGGVLKGLENAGVHFRMEQNKRLIVMP